MSLLVACQSSWAHHATTCRGAYSVKPLFPVGRENGELVIATFRMYCVVTAESGARFHVVTSLTSRIMSWMTAGVSAPLFAVNCPMQVWHVVSHVKSFMYSPPSFMSWRPFALNDIVNASWMSQSSSRMFCGVMACVWPSVKPRSRMTGAPSPCVWPTRLLALFTCANWFQWKSEWPPLISLTMLCPRTCVKLPNSCSLRRLVPMAEAGVRLEPPV